MAEGAKRVELNFPDFANGSADGTGSWGLTDGGHNRRVSQCQTADVDVPRGRTRYSKLNGSSTSFFGGHIAEVG
jgi:hypothetical protein